MGSKVEGKNCVIAPAERGCIEIRGARQNNLKGVDLDLALGKLTVVTGPSGSGKSSLAFDTIYGEGQRRYVETFSPYMRQFLERMDKPRVDDIRGIPPAIAIEQSNLVKTSRSLALFAADNAEGRGGSPNRGEKTPTVLVTFWVAVPAKTKPREFFGFLQQQGYLRIWLNGEIVRVDNNAKVERLGARVQVIQDRITVTEENRARLTEAIETALRFGKGKINVIAISENAQRPTDHQPPITNHEHPFSTGWHCAHCDFDVRPPTPGLFSFNNPLGACPECRGFGRTIAIDLNRAIPDRSLSIAQGVVRVFRGQEMGESQKDLLRACARQEIAVHTPFEELPKADQDFVINGEKRSGEYTDDDYENDRWYGVRGFFRWLESKTYKMHVRVLLSRYRAYVKCPSCEGGRYQPETLNYKTVAAVHPSRRSLTPVRLGPKADDRRNGKTSSPAALTLPEFAALSIGDARDFLTRIELPPSDSTADMLRNEICARLRYLCEVGVVYLTLDRSTRT
ncbi:MAG: excinuclease ABC subunit A, partial [Verrucomicrobia bacterium]